MEAEFLSKFYDQLFEMELMSQEDNDPMFRYIDMLLRVCKKIQQVCNNSRLAISTFASYLEQNFVYVGLEFPKGNENKLMISLAKEEKHVVYFTQISFRLLLLSFYCKQGVETKRKEWRNGLEKLLEETRMEFMFRCHESLSTMLVNLINRISEICNELPFYERLILVFADLDLDYFYLDLNEKKKKLRENFISENAKESKFSFTPKNADSQSSKKGIQKQKTSRKSVKIVNPIEKITEEENLKQRISEFRSSLKKRKSENFGGVRRRTIFQSRTFIKKTDSDSQDCEEYESVFFEESEVPIIESNKEENASQTLTLKTSKVPEENFKGKANSKIKTKHKEQSNFDCDELLMAPGTPPRRTTQNKSKNINSIQAISFF